MIKLDKKDFLKILNNYDIGFLKESKHIDFALDNAVYKLITTKGEYVIKFQEGPVKQLIFQLKILDKLATDNTPTLKVEKNLKGKLLSKHKQKNYFIYKFIKGDHIKNFPIKLLNDFGKTIAKIHESIKNIKGPSNPYIKWKLKMKKPFAQEFNKLKKELKKVDFKKLRKGPIHGDLNDVNILINNSDLILIDWEAAQIDYLTYEIATFISTYLITNKIDYNSIKLFLKGYLSVIKLNDEELKSIYYFIKFRILFVINYCLDHKIEGEWLNQKINEYWLFSKTDIIDFYNKIN